MQIADNYTCSLHWHASGMLVWHFGAYSGNNRLVHPVVEWLVLLLPEAATELSFLLQMPHRLRYRVNR